MIFCEGACICVEECCCHPVKETLAVLACTSQWLKCSEWPAGVKVAVAMQALGEQQGKLRHSSTACPVVPVMFIRLALKEGADTSFLWTGRIIWRMWLPIHIVAILCDTLCPGFMSEYPNHGVVQVLKCYQEAPNPPTYFVHSQNA